MELPESDHVRPAFEASDPSFIDFLTIERAARAAAFVAFEPYNTHVEALPGHRLTNDIAIWASAKLPATSC